MVSALITVVLGIFVGKNLVMVLLQDLVKLLTLVSWMSCWFSLVILLVLGLLCWRVGALPLRYCAIRFAHKVSTWKLPARVVVLLRLRNWMVVEVL